MKEQESRSRDQNKGQLISKFNFTSKTMQIVQISELYIKGQESRSLGQNLDQLISKINFTSKICAWSKFHS
jgi:hypothetical protein